MLLPGYFRHARAIGYRPRWLYVVVIIQIAAVMFEALGLASVVPILEYMKSDASPAELAEHSRGWRIMIDATDTLGIPLSWLSLLIFAFLSIVVRQAFLYIRQIYLAHVQQEFLRTARHRGLSLYFGAREEVRDSHRAGHVVNDLTTELNNAARAMASAANTVSFSLVLVGYFGIVLVLSPSLSVAALVITLAVGIVLGIVTRRIRQIGREVTSTNQSITAFLMERLALARLIRLSGIEASEQALFSVYLDRQRDNIFNLQKLLALFSVLMEPAIMFFGFALLFYAKEWGAIPFETLILFFFILIRLVPVSKEVLASRQGYLSTLGSIETVVRRFDELEGAREIDQGTRSLAVVLRGIEYRDVAFSYAGPPQIPALHGVTLNVPAGQMTALVGPSGAGKSTLVDLLPRIRAPQKGDISIDGVSLDEFSIASLRRVIAFLPQTPKLFNVTVEEMIRYGKPDASDAEVREAARQAQALEFIERLPEGFRAAIGDNGEHLSGGQRQRLDLARALVKGAPILILDEPTSNLDQESDRLFHEALRQIRRAGKTTIILIGHRLASIKLADQIAVLIDGRIEAVGDHEALLRTSSWYARASKNQILPDDVSAMAAQ